MFDTIVVPIDGSGPSQAAIDMAAQFAKARGSRVILCYAVDTIAAGVASAEAFVCGATLIEEERGLGQRLLDGARQRLSDGGVSVDTMLVEGKIVDAIIKAAHDRRAQLIMMASHGRSGLARAFLGSTTEGVLRKASIPVLVVPLAVGGSAASTDLLPA